jgi:CBS domain-containing protein
MTVNEVMTCRVQTIPADATLAEAARKMKDRNVGMLPVLEADVLCGILTDRDIVIRAVSERRKPGLATVREAMTRDVIACYADQDITEAADLMELNLVHRIPVLDRAEQLVGIVSLSDIAAKAKQEGLSGHILRQVSAA